MPYRIWQSGYVAIDKGRRLETIRKVVSAAAAHHPTCVVAEPTRQGSTDPRRRDLWFTWQGNDDRFAALLALRAAESDPRRVDWLLASACTRPWRAAFDAPIVVTGFADEFDPMDHNGDPVGHEWVIPCHNLAPGLLDEFADRVARMVNDPERGSGLLLLPQGDWPEYVASGSLVTTLSIDDTERIAINARLGIRGMRRNQARLYMPPRDGLPDATGPTVPLVLAKDISVGIDQLLMGRQATALPMSWKNDPAVQDWWTTNPFVLPQPEAEDPREKQLARTKQELHEAQRQAVILRQQKTVVDSQLVSALEENQRLRDQLADRDDSENLRTQLAALQDELDRYTAAYDELEAERDALRRRSGAPHAPRQPQTGTCPQLAVDEPVNEDLPDFASFADLLDAARTALPHLVITADPAPAIALDEHPKAPAWRRKAWDSMCTLNAYARARVNRAAPETADVLAFARTGQPGSLISANIIKLRESETVTNNDRCRTARSFPVDPDTSSGGRAYFAAHIALERFKPPAPRLHFLDDVAARGVVCVGYLGEHLPTQNTN
uniref:hypothetical protein n=1 Tax=Amycolatopsis sp. CA-096443 TaxID=3239919 RepID=UPI003F49A0CF